ncbi:maleylpyruvate isomerase family mycothiol-dependent enzyme [Nonomuraea sp. NBC_01738]|uniref:maleylpyruvate isomerase family mycothiol-dependent enzyme n=1 Tax=Nonomuraea sp. NBC_01738 TaxID=2976003 RepID=UPI002E13E6A6|nr:maleylpyruvate isomerase family mycothiol-dependent enzyme [Nonomuraea sp. NBC_01738]
MTELREFDPFDIFDAEAARLDAFFTGLGEQDWARPTRCAGWSVRDVLGHLAGEELYNHAALDGTVKEFGARLAAEGITGFNEFNQWCVTERRAVPVEDVLAEWRAKNGETRRRMRELGWDGTQETMVGPYPNAHQAYHYDSEYATHADDIGVPVGDEEAEGRAAWRTAVGLFALGEAGSKAQVEQLADSLWVNVDHVSAELSYPQFVEATVGRPDPSLDPSLAAALRCLA